MRASTLPAAVFVLALAAPAAAEEPEEIPPPIDDEKKTYPMPALPDPERDPLQPRPYFAPPEPERELPRAEVGAYFGLAYRPSKDSSIGYDAGPTWGGHARLRLLDFLGVRGFVLHSIHAVEVPFGALAENTAVDQPSLDVLLFAARLEASYYPAERVRLWAGPGIGWERIWADEPDTRGALDLHSFNRTGVAVEASAALGADFEIVPRWVYLSAALSSALVMSQSGNAFERVQAIDQYGRLAVIEALPKFASSHIAVLGLSLLL